MTQRRTTTWTPRAYAIRDFFLGLLALIVALGAIDLAVWALSSALDVTGVSSG